MSEDKRHGPKSTKYTRGRYQLPSCSAASFAFYNNFTRSYVSVLLIDLVEEPRGGGCLPKSVLPRIPSILDIYA